jgi:hypothetical protein
MAVTEIPGHHPRHCHLTPSTGYSQFSFGTLVEHLIIKSTSKMLQETLSRAGGMAQVVECLPCKHEDLSPNSSTTQNKGLVKSWFGVIQLLPWHRT